MNLDLLRSFFAIAESGSLSRAADRMRVSQSTLTRQMQALEAEVGGKILERSHRGVALTAAGHILFESTAPLLPKLDAALAEARKRARGESGLLRIGYLLSAASDYVNPALAAVRAAHPNLKVKLLDLSPGEQIAALRRGDLDVALVGNVDASLAREFYVQRIRSLPVSVAVPATHGLAQRRSVPISALKREDFIGAKDEDLPGFNHWLTQLCRRAGFRPRLIENADSLMHALSLVVSENAVTLIPSMATPVKAPGVMCVRLEDDTTHWDLVVAWQRGKTPAPVKTLVAALSK